MTRELQVNREHKDRLFNFIFGQDENREWTLSLYNAVNGSHYTDASQIKFNTLDNFLYISMRNDTSFLMTGTLNLYEHQASYNPNMPVRMMEYVSNLFSAYIKENCFDLYGSALIPLPTPKLVVFYNGTAKVEDEIILKLSDSFEEQTKEETDIEVKVRMLNVNYGENEELLHACKPLEEYAWFVENVREIMEKLKEKDEENDFEKKREHEMKHLSEAVKTTLEIMPKDFLIREFLLRQEASVMGIMGAGIMDPSVQEIYLERGRREGREEGRMEERANTEREMKRADQLDEKVKRLTEILIQNGIEVETDENN